MAPATLDKRGISSYSSLNKKRQQHAQPAPCVATLFPYLETCAWIATSNYSAVLAMGNAILQLILQYIWQENLK